MSSRYFENSYLGTWKHSSEKVTRQWLEKEASTLFERLINAKTGDFDGIDAYTGVSGICYSLFKAIKLRPESKERCFQFYTEKLQSYLKTEVQRDLHGSVARKQSQYLLGTLGALVIGIICEYDGATLNSSYLQRIKEIGQYVLKDNYQGHGDDEMLVGRAGYIAAFLTLKEEVGEKIDTNIVLPVLDKMIESGRKYSREHRCRSPLMYRYHGKEYLGAAHGLMGIIQMLLSFYELLDESAKKDVVATLNWITSTQFPNGNFPTNAAHLTQRHGEDELIQWCHGAAGAVFLYLVAFLKLRDDKYLEVARKAINVLWEKGVLSKGPGICHGVAGNGYAFLMYYRCTRQEKCLEYAKCFARIFCSKTFQSNARSPDSPLSLYEGVAGSLCYLCDLMEPDEAQFPLIPIPFDKIIS